MIFFELLQKIFITCFNGLIFIIYITQYTHEIISLLSQLICINSDLYQS